MSEAKHSKVKNFASVFSFSKNFFEILKAKFFKSDEKQSQKIKA